MEDNYSVDIGEGRWFQNDASAFHLLCTLFLLIYQLHLTLDQALDPGAWGPLLCTMLCRKKQLKGHGLHGAAVTYLGEVKCRGLPGSVQGADCVFYNSFRAGILG